MERIKSCPFCGGEGGVKSIRNPTSGGKSFMRGWVGCPSCGAYIQWSHDPSGAIKKWNRRAHGEPAELRIDCIRCGGKGTMVGTRSKLNGHFHGECEACGCLVME